MTGRVQLYRGPETGPLAWSWTPLDPCTGGEFGGVSPMTLCPSLFFFFSSPLATLPTSLFCPFDWIAGSRSARFNRGRGGVS